jgi:hypothetical protein
MTKRPRERSDDFEIGYQAGWVGRAKQKDIETAKLKAIIAALENRLAKAEKALAEARAPKAKAKAPRPKAKTKTKTMDAASAIA